MTAYYVDSAGSNTSPYDTWAKAATSFATAVAAATASGDVIYVDQAFTETLAADTTYTFANDVNVICSNDKAHEPPQTLGVMGTSAWIGHSSSSFSITLTGAYKVYVYGMTFRISGVSSDHITIGSADGSHFEIENCYLWLGTTAGARIQFGSTGSTANNYNRVKNSTLRFGGSTQIIEANKLCIFDNVTISSSGTAPTTLLAQSSGYGFQMPELYHCNLSHVTGTLIASAAGGPPLIAKFVNCQLGAGVTVLATQTPANQGSSMAWLYNCSASDQHYHLAHYDAFGSTIIDTGIYANDGAKFDGTNGCSWKIITTANCGYYTPYVSPWIDCYHSGTSAITPSLEVVRSGSATAYQNDEVWGEFSYQGTSGYPLATVVSDRKDLLASAADQTTGALGASDWTGESGTSWFGKLNPTSTITPAEIGHLRARVCVGEPEITVYVDPTIRGRS